jgi:hypothetical protein
MHFSLQLTCRQSNELYLWKLLTHFITASSLVLDELGSFKALHEGHTILNAVVEGVESDSLKLERLANQLITEAGVLQVNWKPLTKEKACKMNCPVRSNCIRGLRRDILQVRAT